MPSRKKSEQPLPAAELVANRAKKLRNILRHVQYGEKLSAAGMVQGLGCVQRHNADALATALPDCINDGNETTRRNAVELLGELGPSSAQSVLLRLIDSDEHEELRSWAAIGLKKLARCGSELLDPFLAALHNEERSVRIEACRALYRLENANEIRIASLLDALASLPDPSRNLGTSETMAWLLARNGKGNIPELVRGLESESSAVRLACLKALYYMDCVDADVAGRARKLLDDKDVLAIPAWTTVALARACSSDETFARWIPSLVDVLRIPWADYLSSELKRAALNLLAKAAASAVSAVPVILGVRDQFGGTAWELPIEAFGRDAIPHIYAALTAGTIRDYEAVVWLAKLGDADALGLVDVIVAKESYAHYAAQCYGLMGHAGLDRARRLLEDPSRANIHRFIVAGLGHGKSGISLMSEVLRSGSRAAQVAVAELAGRAKLAELEPQLTSALENEYSGVRNTSACALVRLGHTERPTRILLDEWGRDPFSVTTPLLQTRAVVTDLVPSALGMLAEPENCGPSAVQVLGLLAVAVSVEDKQRVIDTLRDLSGLWSPLRKEAVIVASKLERPDIEVPFPPGIFVT